MQLASASVRATVASRTYRAVHQMDYTVKVWTSAPLSPLVGRHEPDSLRRLLRKQNWNAC